MSKPNLGPSHALAIQLSTSKTNTQNLMTRNPLLNAQIGSGGLLVNNGGSITIQAPGTLNLGGGVLSVALSIMAGTSISAGTTITAGTSISAPVIIGTTNIQGQDLYTANGPTQIISATRVACWLQDSNGLVGTAPSSERFKSDIQPREIDLDALLSLQIVSFQYTNEIRKRDDPEYEGYVGPDYEVATEVGLIAERLDEAGLKEWVAYDRDGLPFAIHYSELTVPLLALAQSQAQEIVALKKQNDDILARLDKAEI